MSKEKVLQPALRFKGFEGDWDSTTLGAVVDLRSGCDYKHLDKGDIPVFGTGGYMLSVNKALSYNENAIGIGRKGTIDRPFILKAPFWTVDTLFYAVPRTRHDLLFTYCIFQNINWREKDESTGVPSLSKTTINTIPVVCCLENEQIQIGLFFKNIDQQLKLHQTKHTKLRQLKKAMLSKMFPKEGEKVPEIRFAGFSGGWSMKKLADIGVTFSGLAGKVKEDFGWGSKYIPYINIFRNTVIDINSLERVKVCVTENQTSVKYGDIFFTTSSETPEEVGMSSVLLTYPTENIYLNSFCFGFRLYDLGCVSPLFMAYLLRTLPSRTAISLLAQGATRYNLSKSQLMQIMLAFPCLQEQTKIGEYFQNLDRLISLQQQQIDKLQHIKKALLEKMFI